jgi:Amt family ammonium transporter
MLGSLLWMAVGYSLVFSGDGPLIGDLGRVLLRGIGMDTVAAQSRIPEMLFMLYQMTFAVITVALVAGSVADRMRFTAFVWFAALWLIFV